MKIIISLLSSYIPYRTVNDSKDDETFWCDPSLPFERNTLPKIMVTLNLTSLYIVLQFLPQLIREQSSI
jgi:hypothetical protein